MSPWAFHLWAERPWTEEKLRQQLSQLNTPPTCTSVWGKSNSTPTWLQRMCSLWCIWTTWWAVCSCNKWRRRACRMDLIWVEAVRCTHSSNTETEQSWLGTSVCKVASHWSACRTACNHEVRQVSSSAVIMSQTTKGACLWSWNRNSERCLAKRTARSGIFHWARKAASVTLPSDQYPVPTICRCHLVITADKRWNCRADSKGQPPLP